MLHEVDQLLGGIHDASQYWANVNAEKLEVVWFMMRTCEMTHWVLSLTLFNPGLHGMELSNILQQEHTLEDPQGFRIPDSFRGERGCLFGMLCCGMYRGSIRKMHDSSFFPKETLPVLGIKETLLLRASNRHTGLRGGGRLFQNTAPWCLKNAIENSWEIHESSDTDDLAGKRLKVHWSKARNVFFSWNTVFEVRGFLAILGLEVGPNIYSCLKNRDFFGFEYLLQRGL